MFHLIFAAFACFEAPDPSPAPQCEEAQTVFLDTPDGARIGLHRHPGDGPAVIVIHGIASNHRCWDLDADRSFAVALQQAGLDPWLLNLRGHGSAMVDAQGERQRHGWSMDDYGRIDLHQAIEHIRSVTGQERVAIVGHSMGGMITAAYHAEHGDQALWALAVVASPIAFENGTFLTGLGGLGMGMGTAMDSVGMPVLAGWAAAVPGPLPVHGEHILFNPKNMNLSTRRSMLKTIVSPVSREELRQFAEVVNQERFTSADGSVDYVDAFSSFSSPLLVMAGGGDKIAPPSMVRPWIDAAESADETWIEASTAQGFSADYGHLDLPLGDQAATEIYPLIIGWLLERAPASSPEGSDVPAPDGPAPSPVMEP